MESCLAREGLLPEGQRLAHEPPGSTLTLFGITAYLEPDFAALTPSWVFKVPRQLRDPHPAVVAFQDKRDYVTKPQIARAARFLQAIVSATTEVGWKVSKKVPNGYTGRGEVRPDLSISLPSGEIVVTVRELDRRGRLGLAFVTDTDLLHPHKNARSRISTSGLRQAGGDGVQGVGEQPILTIRDTDGAALEEHESGWSTILFAGRAATSGP